MHKILTIIILIALTLSLHACNKSADNPDNLSDPEPAVVHPVNLDGVSVHLDMDMISYSRAGELVSMPEDWVLLYVNGSIAHGDCAFMEDGTVYVSYDAVCEELSLEKAELSGEGIIKVDDTMFLAMDTLTATVGCEAVYYPDNSTGSAMGNYPHVMVFNYPAGAAVSSREEALSRLENQLIQAYEHKFGTYEPLDEVPAEYTNEATYLRVKLADLSIKAENDRFYIAEFVWDFYIDKYTDEIFYYYNGMNQSIFRFDPTADSALTFAG